ncbi:hypothetical protein AMTR_s00112p00071510 [Amborella trichopoda]|uniref:Uncharacterized protein n=1 Tax=Amborella trichopoda TaxID=13333 RepID=W1NWU2_AMBTC|nr:hypothetical protein AMTR_s00112p00071510 [Amborella trichopoda]
MALASHLVAPIEDWNVRSAPIHSLSMDPPANYRHKSPIDELPVLLFAKRVRCSQGAAKPKCIKVDI